VCKNFFWAILYYHGRPHLLLRHFVAMTISSAECTPGLCTRYSRIGWNQAPLSICVQHNYWKCSTTQDSYTLYMTILSWHNYTTWQPCHLLLVTSYVVDSWYIKGEESTPIFRTSCLIWFCHMSIFYKLSTKHLTLKFCLCLSNHTNI